MTSSGNSNSTYLDDIEVLAVTVHLLIKEMHSVPQELALPMPFAGFLLAITRHCV